MDTLNIEKFDPTTQELTAMVVLSKKITELSDPLEIRTMRLDLKNARVSITKKGKELREDAIAYQKAVIAKEKELIEIIEPEEERLAGIEELAKKRREREDRKELLPMRLARLEELNIALVPEETLLDMDTAQFTEFVNNFVADRNERNRLALEEKERAIKEAEARIEQERLAKEREEKAREEERLKAEQRIKDAEAEAERRVKEAEERAKQEAEAKEKARLAEEAKKKAEAEAEAKRVEEETKAREEDERYRKWLADNGATPDVQGWMAIRDPYGANEMVLYKEVSRYQL